MERVTEHLMVEASSETRQSPSAGVSPAAGSFEFRLCRKQTAMGDICMDQWWMDHHGLYGERNACSANRESVIAYFWALCHQHGTVSDHPVQESYILTRLLPHARSNGSRRVFADATLTQPKYLKQSKSTVIQELETLLEGSREERLNEVSFRDRTAAVLGPPEYGPEVWDCYMQFEADVLGEGVTALETRGEDGLSVALERWAEKMRRIGRRRGHQIEKEVLDIFSYEARAAFHRCYAAVWLDLIPHLRSKYDFTQESDRFHRLWHLVLQQESCESPDINFYVFHGHIFGLHPACSDFMLTRTGPEMVGDWMANPHSVPKYEQLLHGLLVASHHYAQRNEVYSLLRKKAPETVSDLVAQEEQSVERRSGRRRLRRPKSDAC